MKITRTIKRLLITSASPFWRLLLIACSVDYGKNVLIIGRPRIRRKIGSIIELGDGVVLCSSAVANPLCGGMRCHLATFDSKARLVIERNVGLSATIICCARSVKIGAGTLVGGGAIITDTDFHSRRTDGSWATDPLAVSESVEIGKNCFIGTRAVVLKGVVIGDGAVVGAGAVVANSIPPGSVAVGNPARVIHDEGLSKIIRDKVQM